MPDKKTSQIFVDNPVTPVGTDILYLSRAGTDAASLVSSLVSFVDTQINPGDVFGPANSTLNAVPRYADTSGKLLKDSGATLDDDITLTAETFTATRTVVGGNADSRNAFFAQMLYTSNTNRTASLGAIGSQIIVDSTATLGGVRGADISLYIEGANTVTLANGVESYTENLAGGTVGIMRGYVGSLFNSGAGTVTLMEGFATINNIGNYTGATGHIGTLIHFHANTTINAAGATMGVLQGLKIEDMAALTGVTTKQAINYADTFIVDAAGIVSAPAYKVGATAGIDFSGPVTSITVVKGIVTAAS